MLERESEDSIHIIAFFIQEIGILSLELLAKRPARKTAGKRKRHKNL